jgi:hypothetical protein
MGRNEDGELEKEEKGGGKGGAACATSAHAVMT